jgi:YggT family protein
MQSALAFLVSALLDLYVISFFLRLVMAWVRADFRNPLAQFIIKITNPLVIPARRFIPALAGLDTATLVVMLAVQTLATAIVVQLACVGGGDLAQIAIFGLVRLAHLVLRTFSLLMLVYVITSWVSGGGGYNPAIALLAAIVEPLLTPFRRFIPTIGGLDLSPVFALLAIEFVNRLIPAGPAFAGLICMPT